MSNVAHINKNNVSHGNVPATIPANKPKKKERTPEEKEALMNQFLLGINGYHVGEVKEGDLDKMNNYVIQGDGIYLVIDNRIGQFITKVNNMEFPGLPKQFKGTRIKLKVPKIPSSIYEQIKKFFTDISEDMGEAEAFCQVYYDTKEKEYVVHVPEQTVSKASVNYDATKNLSEVDSERYIFVYEVHSHNTMGAFWSGTDNADEKDTRFYGVLGNLDKETIGEKYRYMIMGKEVEVKKEHIFDFTENLAVDKDELLKLIEEQENLTIDDLEQFMYAEEEVEYPKTWIDNIKKPTSHYSHGPGHGGYGGNYGGNYTGQSQKNQNSGTAGRQTHINRSTTHGNRGYGSSYYDEWDDDYDNQYGYGNYPSSYNSDKAEGERMAWLESVHDAYDLSELDQEDEIDAALEAFAGSIEPMHIGILVEKLVDNGHEGELTSCLRSV
jgi:PRTRC genetic system protein A